MADPIQSCVISRVNKQVRLQINSGDLGLSWSMAMELSRLILAAGKAARQFSRDFQAGEAKTLNPQNYQEKYLHGPITLHVTGPAVVWELNGKQWFAHNYRTAPQLAVAVRRQAQLIEEEIKAQQIIADQALLLRHPVLNFIGLSDNPQIQRAAWKAAEDVKLPVMVEPTAIVHTPSVLQYPPILVTQ